jgi:hypothetical protein
VIAHTTNQRRYAATSKTTAAFALAAGRALKSTLEAGYTLLPLGTIRKQGGDDRFAGVRLTMFGDGNDNQTFDYRVFVGFIENPSDPVEAQVVSVLYLGGGSATLSAAVGISGSTLLSATERVADTLTWTLGASTTTPKGIGETIEATRGQGRASAAWSPADNSEAFVDLPELGGAAYLILDFDMTGATGGNALVEELD